VKTCLEIALSCVEPDKAKRPSIRDIVCELRKTETNGTGSSWDKVYTVMNGITLSAPLRLGEVRDPL